MGDQSREIIVKSQNKVQLCDGWSKPKMGANL